MQQYRYVSAYQTTLVYSTSALCSSVLFNCSAHSSVPLLCCSANLVSFYSTDLLILCTPLLSSNSSPTIFFNLLATIYIYIYISVDSHPLCSLQKRLRTLHVPSNCKTVNRFLTLKTLNVSNVDLCKNDSHSMKSIDLKISN